MPADCSLCLPRRCIRLLEQLLEPQHPRRPLCGLQRRLRAAQVRISPAQLLDRGQDVRPPLLALSELRHLLPVGLERLLMHHTPALLMLPCPRERLRPDALLVSLAGCEDCLLALTGSSDDRLAFGCLAALSLAFDALAVRGGPLLAELHSHVRSPSSGERA